MISHRSTGALLAALLLSACGSDAVQTISAPATGARIRFYNFAVNAPGVNFYANDVKVTATSSTSCTPPTDPKCTAAGIESTLGTTYGGVGNGGLYSAIAPGQYTLTGRIAATTDKDLVVSTLASTIADGKTYSLFTSGFYNTTTKQMEAFFVEDDYPAAIDFDLAHVRFVNAISNSSPLTLYLKLTDPVIEGPLGGPVAYKGTTPFTVIPPGVYDLSARLAGSTTNVIVRTAVSFVRGRVYTIGARGDMTVTSATATNRPTLDFTTNR